MASRITEEEAQQLLQTIEMFEAITETQPEDYQSLEILKEAYVKLGRPAESLRVSKKLAAAYSAQGQVSQAILEYEGILQDSPNDPVAQAALADLDEQAKLDVPSSSEAPPLATDSKPMPATGMSAGAPTLPALRLQAENDDRALGNALVTEKLTTPQALEPLLRKLQAFRKAVLDKNQPLALSQMLVNEQIAKMDDLLTVMIDRSGLPYLPLPIYDVDRDVALLLPLDLCWQFCLTPVDQISRSVLIATANPFGRAARTQVETLLKCHVFWYISAPTDITTALRRSHSLDEAREKTVAS